MFRPITVPLFKAKSIKTNEWVEGYIYQHLPPPVCFSNDVKEENKWYIIRSGFADWNMPRPVEKIEVIPETICAYTGMNDTDEKPIFDNDLVLYQGKIYQVFWNDELFQWEITSAEYLEEMVHYEFNSEALWNTCDMGWVAAEMPCVGKITTKILGSIFDNDEIVVANRLIGTKYLYPKAPVDPKPF